MNNYWFTNFRPTQEGDFHWSYFLTSTSERGNSAATRFGWSSRVPLATRVLPPLKSGSMEAIKPYIELGEVLGKIYYQTEKETVQKVEVVFS